ncbi:MAG TPA: alpha/beta hydrolase fold domain-containing protein [Kofleriaceae bacterium]|nr:alpha/beta hydrolase fold domain-containing protein [Kofleriaceae bacterium]
MSCSAIFAALACGCAAPLDPTEIDDGTDPAADGDPATDGEPAVEEAAPTPQSWAALTPDPSAVVGNGWCYWNYTWNGTSARVYAPSNGGCDSSIHSPLVVLMRGVGFPHTNYHYLLRHLARNGYIGVAVDSLPSGVTQADYQAAADDAWAFVKDFMWTTWSKRFFIDPSRVGLIGHSRGGEAVKFLAEKLKADPVFDVRAVISLAPTNFHHVKLTGQNTVGAMTIVGSADADTTTDRAYSSHDETGSDASQQDPAINPSVVYRSMKLLGGGNHGGFAAEAAQGSVTQGYALAFLHAHLKGDVTYYEDYVRGDSVPFGWPSAVTTQESDGFLRRVIDNFDDGATANSTIGGNVAVAFGAGGVIDLGSSTITPHHTHALQYTAPPSGSGFWWSIPAGKRNVTAFKYLSLRVGQIDGPATDDLRVRIFNSGVASPWVRVTDHGPLAQPVNMCLQSALGICQLIDVQAHMGTIRISLDAFGAHNDVTAVEIGAANEAIGSRFLIDNLEFSEFILKP